MNLVILYGPPGVGKLTIARALSKVTGYKVFHNHVTADIVHSVFPFGKPEYAKLTEKIRLDIIEAAARYKVPGMIFTFVYGVETHGGKSDDAMVRKIIRRVEKHRGKVFLVRLWCEDAELHRRIRHPSRKAFAKLKSVKVLKDIRKKYHLDHAIPFRRGMEIDNTRLSPQKVARMIKNRWRL